MISSRYIDVPEVLSVQVVPSVEVRMVRLLPTETSNSVVLSVVVLDVLLLLLHEIMVRLKRNRERKMSRCFTRFPISGYRRTKLYHDLEDFTRMWEDYGGVSDSVKN